MNRALPLILLAAAAAGALAYLALEGAPEPAPPADGETVTQARVEPRPAPRGTEPARLAPPTPVASRKTKRATDGEARYLEIVPMNARGQAVAEAQVVAKRPGETLTGTGRVRWDTPAAGEWTVTVTAPELPTWERALVIGNGERRREAARLTEELRIEGRVLDTYGAPVPKAQVYLLPPGKSHPLRSDIATSRDERGRVRSGPTNGAVGATTFANGTFKATLPSAGEWRVSVGLPGEPEWTQRKGFELTVGGPDRVEVVVPARSRLTVVADGPAEQRPSQVSAYVYDAELAARVAFQRGERERLGAVGADLKTQQRLLKEQAMAEGKDGAEAAGKGGGDETSDPVDEIFARSQKEANLRAYEERMAALEAERDALGAEGPARAPLFDDGWRPVGSGRFDGSGEAVIENLPGGTTVQFLFVRGRERITTAVGVSLRDGVRSIGTVELPPPSDTAGQIHTRRGEARVEVAVDEAAGAAQAKPGATWSLAGL